MGFGLHLSGDCQQRRLELRERIHELENQNLQLQDRMDELRKESAKEKQELLDRLIAVLNPAAARAMMMPREPTRIPPGLQQPGDTVRSPDAPPPARNYRDQPAVSSPKRVAREREREPVLTPEMARFGGWRKVSSAEPLSGGPAEPAQAVDAELEKIRAAKPASS